MGCKPGAVGGRKVASVLIKCGSIAGHAGVSADGVVHLSVPFRFATIAEGEAFLRAHWKWCVAARARAMARASAVRTPPTEAEVGSLAGLIAELHEKWTGRLGEHCVKWSLRRMKSVWGSCHWAKRHITYNMDLARQPRELVEYVVVHELTHFAVHNHGPRFKALMDERLPGWPELRRRLNRPLSHRP